MGLQIEVRGLTQVQQYLNNTSSKIYKDVDKSVKKAGLFLQSEVQQSVSGHRAEKKSVDTGRFLNSIKSEGSGKLSSRVYTNVSYAQFLEYGTTRMMARHHFTNSTKRNEIKIKDFIEKAITTAIK